MVYLFDLVTHIFSCAGSEFVLLQKWPDARERQDVLGGAQPDGFPRHAKDDACLFVLGRGSGSRLAQPQKAGGAVGAHACQQRGDGVRAGSRLHG